MNKHEGGENEGMDHQKQIVLILKQILPTYTMTSMWRPMRRIYVLILGLRGSQHQVVILVMWLECLSPLKCPCSPEKCLEVRLREEPLSGFL